MGFFDAQFIAYLAVAALLIVTPGPDTALVTRNALLAGRCAASFTTLGIGAGSFIWALASMLGIAVLLEESVVAFTIFKFAAAATWAILASAVCSSASAETSRRSGHPLFHGQHRLRDGAPCGRDC